MTDIYNHFQQAFSLNHSSEIPLYKQIENYVIAQVRLGVFQEGDKMISENELCALLNVSRTTVRQAMEALYKKGIVSKVRGKGTFFASEKVQHNLSNLYNFTESVMASGLEPSADILFCGVMTADELIAEKLNLRAENRRVFKLERLRKADNNLISLVTTYIPYYLCQGIEKINFEHRSLYNVLEKIFQLQLKYADETIEAGIVADAEQAALLDYPQGSAGFFIHRLSYLDDKQVLEYSRSVIRGDRCTLRLTLTSGNKEDLCFKKIYQ